MEAVLPTPEATFEWGRDLSASLCPGSVIGLCGQLGAGKTQAVKGIVAGFGSRADVTSPTFTLVHEYLDGRAPVFHFDFYRMESSAEVLTLGWDDYLDERGIVVVEWADLFPGLLPPGTRWFYLEALPDQATRRVREGAAPS